MNIFRRRGKKENQAIHAKLDGGSNAKNTETRTKLLQEIKKDEAKVLALESGVSLSEPKRHEDYYHFAEGHAYSKRPEIKKEKK